MPAFFIRWPLPAALCAAVCAAAAQTAPAPVRQADPLDAAASVPATRHQSAFSRQRPAAGDQPIPWRDANDTAARIGGWRAYAREAQPPQPGPQTRPPVHGGHQLP